MLKLLQQNQLLQFALVGGLVFLLYSMTATTGQRDIVITGAAIDDMIDVRSQVLGHTLSDEEKKALINNLIDEEVLLREAYDLGLDKNDSKLRERLVYKMRFLLSKEMEEPSLDSLMAFYRGHLDLYMKPEFITFDQVFFEKGMPIPETESFLKKLLKTKDYGALGDSLPLGSHFEGHARGDLTVMFGEAFVDALFDADPGVWTGPVTSEHGTHFVRPLEVIPSVPYPFDNVRSFVRDDWSVYQGESTLKAQMDLLKEGYTIRIVD